MSMSYSYWWSEIQTIRKTSYFQTSVQQFFRLYRLLLLIQVNTRINIMWWGLLDQWSTTPEILNRFSCRTLFSEYLLCNNCCGQNLINILISYLNFGCVTIWWASFVHIEGSKWPVAATWVPGHLVKLTFSWQTFGLQERQRQLHLQKIAMWRPSVTCKIGNFLILQIINYLGFLALKIPLGYKVSISLEFTSDA